jgi:Domain of Unknown Function (DUF748)
VKRLAIVLGVVVALCLIVRLILDPLATRETRKVLHGLDGFDGDVGGVHVTLFPPSYTITRLAVWPTPDGTRREPLFFVERLHATLSGADLFHLHLVGSLRLEDPKVSIINHRAAKPEKTAKPAAPAPDLSPQLTKAVPFRVARVEIVRGELLFRDDTEPLHPEVWVHHLELVAENFANRTKLEGGRPTRVTARGMIGKTGALELFVTADPLARPLAFAGRLSMKQFEVRELYAFVEPKAHVQTPKGTIDVFAEFVSRAGALTGGVKAVLKNVEVRPISDSLWDRLRAWLGDKAVELISDRVPGRNAIATTVPIKGALTHPDIQLWPAVLGVVRNAFVEGLASGFSNLPVPTAPEKEGKLAQAKDALTKSEGPPQAQPADSAKPAASPKPAAAKPAAPKPVAKGH